MSYLVRRVLDERTALRLEKSYERAVLSRVAYGVILPI